MNRSKQAKILKILNEVIFPCSFGGKYLVSERTPLQGVYNFLCAREICEILESKLLTFMKKKHSVFKNHQEGIEIVKTWARSMDLEFKEEVDISVGVADVLVYADDLGIFEIGTTKPAKIVLLLKYLMRARKPFTLHLWPYGTADALVFRNWR
jgi:hypothetical protein